MSLHSYIRLRICRLLGATDLKKRDEWYLGSKVSRLRIYDSLETGAFDSATNKNRLILFLRHDLVKRLRNVHPILNT